MSTRVSDDGSIDTCCRMTSRRDMSCLPPVTGDYSYRKQVKRICVCVSYIYAQRKTKTKYNWVRMIECQEMMMKDDDDD